ncbi:hypothetical protein ACFLRT_04230 [Acidobacteriota bacterium]
MVNFSGKLKGGFDRVVCQQECQGFQLGLAVTMSRGGSSSLGIDPVEVL